MAIPRAGATAAKREPRQLVRGRIVDQSERTAPDRIIAIAVPARPSFLPGPTNHPELAFGRIGRRSGGLCSPAIQQTISADPFSGDGLAAGKDGGLPEFGLVAKSEGHQKSIFDDTSQGRIVAGVPLPPCWPGHASSWWHRRRPSGSGTGTRADVDCTCQAPLGRPPGCAMAGQLR